MKWFLAAVLAGLLAAAPFLTTRALGTREAYNYSLSVADAVTQFRTGEIPMLAGQTAYAFNGRVHPLRTAPALAYATSLLDLFSFRQLSFWTLQNLVLGLSLIGAAAACYWALRWATPATPPLAALLTFGYVWCPALLAAAYGMDLYMTVLTAPLVPLIVAANLRAFSDADRGAVTGLAIALAACWLAHPPIALWMTIATGLLQLAALAASRPSRRGWWRTILAAPLFGLLSGFAFVSALSASPYGDIVHQRDLTLLYAEVARVFPASLRPVSSRADQLGDFQVGYFLLACGGLALVLGIARRVPGALAAVAVAACLLAFTVPVPGVHHWLWDHVPTLVINLTNQWPMQRLYLPIGALCAFGLALAWRPPASAGKLIQDGVRLGLAAAVAWCAWQGGRFVARGFATHQTAAATAQSHLSSNLDLTPISYALLGAPGDFTNGVMDPAFSFRVLAPYDAHEAQSNWTAPATALRTLTLTATPGATDDILDLGATLTLEPGRRYRLDFEFASEPVAATFQLTGQSLRREYPLPSAGGPRGFGMKPGNRAALTLWTDQPAAELVNLRLVGPGLARSPLRGKVFARVRVSVVDPAALPIELQSLLPLRARVRADAAGYLETPRAFLPGYRATVDGRDVRVQSSPDGLAMFAVPAGEHQVELRFAGTPALHAIFWLGVIGWLAAGVAGAVRLLPGGRRAAVAARAQSASSILFSRRGAIVAVTLAVFGIGFAGWQHWRARPGSVGPVHLRFVLPRGETNRQQPLVVTGKPHAGMFVYVVYADAEHVRIGVDVWGVLGWQSEPIRTDYFAEHDLVVDAGALFPPGTRSGPDHLRITFDGAVVFDRDTTTHPSAAGEVTYGENKIGGSSCEPRFAGRILLIERLREPSR